MIYCLCTSIRHSSVCFEKTDKISLDLNRNNKNHSNNDNNNKNNINGNCSKNNNNSNSTNDGCTVEEYCNSRVMFINATEQSRTGQDGNIGKESATAIY